MKKIINTSNAPAAIGPYSQAVLVDNTLYCSGQIALDPLTGDLVMDTIEEETEQVMKNIEAVLAASKMNFKHVVKCSIFMSSIEYYDEINEIYSRYFKGTSPAREAVAVKTLPKNVNVEISVSAHNAI